MGETESGIVCGLPSDSGSSCCRQRVAKERTRLVSVHNDDIRGVPFGLIEHLVILSESKQRIRIPTTPQKVFLSLAAAVDCGYRAESLKNGQGVDRAGAARDGRYARKHGGFLAHLGEYPGGCVLLQRGGQLEESMRTRRARVHDALGNTLVIEMGDLFAEDEILQKRRAARIGPERVLIIGKCEALVRGERGVTSTSDLVQVVASSQVCGSVRGRAFFLFVFSRLTRCFFFAHDLSPWRVLPAYRAGLRASGPRRSRSAIRAPDVLLFSI